MRREELERLYKELIIPESKKPYHFEKREGKAILAYNPICGDKYSIYPDPPVHFHGHGCALSKASTSLLMQNLENKSSEAIKELILRFINAVRTGDAKEEFDPGLSTLVALKQYDGREDCILLSWIAMLDYLERNEARG